MEGQVDKNTERGVFRKKVRKNLCILMLCCSPSALYAQELTGAVVVRAAQEAGECQVLLEMDMMAEAAVPWPAVAATYRAFLDIKIKQFADSDMGDGTTKGLLLFCRNLIAKIDAILEIADEKG